MTTRTLERAAGHADDPETGSHEPAWDFLSDAPIVCTAGGWEGDLTTVVGPSEPERGPDEVGLDVLGGVVSTDVFADGFAFEAGLGSVPRGPLAVCAVRHPGGKVVILARVLGERTIFEITPARREPDHDPPPDSGVGRASRPSRPDALDPPAAWIAVAHPAATFDSHLTGDEQPEVFARGLALAIQELRAEVQRLDAVERLIRASAPDDEP